MRILKTKGFTRYARRAGLQDNDLCQAADRANLGVVDADLGGGVIKQRIARPGEGKSGGFRTIVLFKIGTMAVFVYGFAKNEKSNIQPNELTAFRKLAAALLAYDEAALTEAVKEGALMEVTCEAAEAVIEEEVTHEQAVQK